MKGLLNLPWQQIGPILALFVADNMKNAVRWVTSIELTEKETVLVFLSSCAPLGGTSESDTIFSPTVRKHLRKTRLELLHKEYEVRTWGVL